MIGAGGSGKTHAARRLARAIGVEPLHLDAAYYGPEWETVPPGEFAQFQRRAVEGDRWVMDGNYASTLPIRLGRADTVVWLDLHPLVCLVAVVCRQLRYGPGQRRALGVYNRLSPGFLRYVWSYRRRMVPRVEPLLAQHAASAAVYRPRTRAEADRLIDGLLAQQLACPAGPHVPPAAAVGIRCSEASAPRRMTGRLGFGRIAKGRPTRRLQTLLANRRA